MPAGAHVLKANKTHSVQFYRVIFAGICSAGRGVCAAADWLPGKPAKLANDGGKTAD